jgi:hypothetical protein
MPDTKIHRSIRVVHASKKRRRRSHKSHSFPKVTPIHNEAKETISHSAEPESLLKISTNSTIDTTLPSMQPITDRRKSTCSSLKDDSVKPLSEKNEE